MEKRIHKIAEILRKETVSLKTQYIGLSDKFASEEYDQLMQKSDWSYEQWKDAYPIRISHKTVTLSKLGNKIREDVRIAKKIGKEKHIEIERNRALQHYENSILKLAIRIDKKALDINKLRANTSHIGVNIETFLTDGNKTVFARTIIAHGPIQRPHYRYIVR